VPRQPQQDTFRSKQQRLPEKRHRAILMHSTAPTHRKQNLITCLTSTNRTRKCLPKNKHSRTSYTPIACRRSRWLLARATESIRSRRPAHKGLCVGSRCFVNGVLCCRSCLRETQKIGDVVSRGGSWDKIYCSVARAAGRGQFPVQFSSRSLSDGNDERRQKERSRFIASAIR